MAGVVAHPERALARDEEERYAHWVQRRAAGEPVAYILGRREFYGLDLEVTPAVLIPRPETELLVELALAHIAPGAAAKVADLGTGSGAIALAVKRERPQARVIAIDASPAALAVARANAERLQLNIEFRSGDWFAPLAGESFDLVLANPPYVASGDPHLAQGDLRFEPRDALVSGPDGLSAIRHIVSRARPHLVDGGLLLIEHGAGQDVAVRELMANSGLQPFPGWRDLAGILRVAGGERRKH